MNDEKIKAVAIRSFNNLKSVGIGSNPDASEELEMEVKDILLGFDSKDDLSEALTLICTNMDTDQGEEPELLPIVLTKTPQKTSGGQWFIEMDAADFMEYFGEE